MHARERTNSSWFTAARFAHSAQASLADAVYAVYAEAGIFM
jgi:hypothetical protein